MQPDDWPAVLAIYAAGIATANATFETKPPSWQQWDADHLPNLRFVSIDAEGTIASIWLHPALTQLRDGSRLIL